MAPSPALTPAQLRTLTGILRRRCPTDRPVRVRRRPLVDEWGTCEVRGRSYLITLDSGMGQPGLTWCLIHEWAHAMTWSICESWAGPAMHPPELWLAYGRAYEALIEGGAAPLGWSLPEFISHLYS